MAGRPAAVRSIGVVAVVAAGVVVGIVLGDLFTLGFFLPYAMAGSVLAIRRPGNAIGWLLIVTGWLTCLATLRVTGDPTALAAGTAPLGDSLVAWGSVWAWNGTFAAFVVLTLVFPSGHLPVGRSNLLAWGLAGAAVMVTAVTMLAPNLAIGTTTGVTVRLRNPLPHLPDSPLWSVLSTDVGLFVLSVALFGCGVVWLVRRYRSSSDLERLQVRWLLAALAAFAALTGVGFGASVASDATAGDPRTAGALFLVWLPSIGAYLAVPTAIGIAVLRYRLYAIDRIISRSLAWAIVTATLVATFAVVVVGMQAAFAGAVGGTLPVAASTLVVAALFQPLRRRIQFAVDRRFDRRHYDATMVVEGFSSRLRDEVDLQAVRNEIARVADETVRPTTTAIWIRSGRQT